MSEELAETSRPKRDAFLAAYAILGNKTRAAEAAGCDRHMHLYWLEHDHAYPVLFDKAHREATERLTEEARRRAVDGVDEPVFYKGDECGSIRRYSDTLLIFLMKGAMPETYRERYEVSGPDGGPVRIVRDLTDAELEAIAARAMPDADSPA